MTYQEFKELHQAASMTEAEFNLFVRSFDLTYGAFVTTNGIYDEALELFLLKNDGTNKTTNATSRAVGGVSISNTVTSETTSNWDDLFNDLLKAYGWGAAGEGAGSGFNGFIVC